MGRRLVSGARPTPPPGCGAVMITRFLAAGFSLYTICAGFVAEKSLGCWSWVGRARW